MGFGLWVDRQSSGRLVLWGWDPSRSSVSLSRTDLEHLEELHLGLGLQHEGLAGLDDLDGHLRVGHAVEAPHHLPERPWFVLF